MLGNIAYFLSGVPFYRQRMTLFCRCVCIVSDFSVNLLAFLEIFRKSRLKSDHFEVKGYACAIDSQPAGSGGSASVFAQESPFFE